MEKISSNEVIELVRKLLQQSSTEISASERREQKKYSILIQSKKDKQLLTRMLDESSQIRDNKRLSRRIKYLIDYYGMPGFFNSFDTLLIKAFVTFGYLFDFVAMPIFKKKLRQDTSKVIIDERKSVFFRHLNRRRKERIGQNVNLLGEVVLGDREANERYEHYLEALRNPKINYISIKISGIYAQINPLNYQQNKLDLSDKIAAIYRQAMTTPYVDEQGKSSPKFVNLDMEEYKDTHLTLDVFCTVLSMPEFKNYPAGIVIQSYLPDAWNFQTVLIEFAKKRVQDGGAPIKMRLVKGANLAMETVISSLKGWENPIYDNKIDVDANYLRILDRALLPENASCVQVGVASHNLFTIAYAHMLAQKNQVESSLSFEMLEGMANYLPRVLKSINRQIILYTPVVNDQNFLNAVSYLVRRLDENTGKDNFLSYSFNLEYGSDTWKFLMNQFQEAYNRKDTVSITPRRIQDQSKLQKFEGVQEVFVNEPDTDFDLPQNRQWAEEIDKKWKKSEQDEPYHIPVQLGEKQIRTEKTLPYFDHSQDDRICVCDISLADSDMVGRMIELSEKDASGWAQKPLSEINEILQRTAVNIANKRGDLIGCMAAITGKTFREGDVEVSEAIDFCRYYPISLTQFAEMKTIDIKPKGLVLVIPPWNFPTAIPVGGVAAALAGGNRVILKPATVAFPIAWEFVQCFWDAGVPKDALQIVCTDGREPQKVLTTHPAVKQIIFTGGTDTALRLMEQNPGCPISAETGGKNAMILTSGCDRDHAILNVLTSAFSNAGQKCSACSLLLLEKDIYDDPDFKEKLRDAVISLHAGQVWDHGNIVGPMVTNVNDKLEKAFTLEDGESWLVEPSYADELRYALRPTVKWGVKPGSYSFNTEFFAPLLSVVRMDNLEEGIQMVNSTGYGLTSGLQSLDEREHAIWKDKIEAGNLYINRGITGAIVSRQPFGGMKLSAFGPGIKAGGPNYAVSMMEVSEVPVDVAYLREKELTNWVALGLLHLNQALRVQAAIDSQIENNEKVFKQEIDIHQIHGEQNTLRYLALKNILFRVQEEDSISDVLIVLKAAAVSGTDLEISCNPKTPVIEQLKQFMNGLKLTEESEAQFIERMSSFERVRACSANLSTSVYEAAARKGIWLATAKPVVEGRVELLHYVKEQSISYEYHRYGNIVED